MDKPQGFNLMKKYFLFFLLFLSCNENEIIYWENYDETNELIENFDHEITRMRYKRIQSISNDKNDIFRPFHSFIKSYNIEFHNSIKQDIINRDISYIQSKIDEDLFGYEDLVKFFIYRIYKYEMNKDLYLNSIISLNPNVISQARELDKNESDNPLYGIPILVKDNINVGGMVTSAGASAFKNNLVSDDAEVIKNLKKNNVLILGKLNMSEWAYYFCRPCPVGYSSLGGQTLNPYGRKIFESGGSSSGSGVSIAANFAVASLGSETSGSILSPSSKNSLVGLKPTIGNISRSGIVPISSFYDTSGPMTNNVLDNAIIYNSMIGFDQSDGLSKESIKINIQEMQNFESSNLKIGYSSRYLSDSLFTSTVNDLQSIGIDNISYTSSNSLLPYFRGILTSDMKRDLPKYIDQFASENIVVKNVSDIVKFNNTDTITHAPYNQFIFNEIVNDRVSNIELEKMKKSTRTNAREFLNELMSSYNFDVFVSVDNTMAGIAAAAHFPALTVPMGYRKNGEPSNITFITRSNNEQLLYNFAYLFEKNFKRREPPKNYN
jgi:amidase